MGRRPASVQQHRHNRAARTRPIRCLLFLSPSDMGSPVPMSLVRARLSAGPLHRAQRPVGLQGSATIMIQMLLEWSRSRHV